MRLALCILLLFAACHATQDDPTGGMDAAFKQCKEDMPNSWRATADGKGLVHDMITLYGMDPPRAREMIQRLAREFQECLKHHH
jgi:hypothetical protein